MKCEIIQVELTIKANKEMYTASPWQTKEELFNDLVIDRIDNDLNFIKKGIAEQCDIAEQNKYSGFIKTLETLKKEIQKTIQYEIIADDNEIETVKISFSFPYYETNIVTYKQLVDNRIINDCIKNKRFLAKDFGRFKYEELGNVTQLYQHVADFLEEAKSTVKINSRRNTKK